MIIYHQNNVAAFKGNHVFYTLTPFQLASWTISQTSTAPPVTFKAAWASQANVVIGASTI